MDKIRASGFIIRQLTRLQSVNGLTRPANRAFSNIKFASSARELSIKTSSSFLSPAIGCLSTRAHASSCSTKKPIAMVEIATYDEIKDLPNHPEKVLIDVREPDELKETGQIPTSINIPLAMVQKALSDETSDVEFKRLYGRIQPDCDQEIIFTCKTGRRAGIAADTAVKLGFTNVKNYKGSWTEWAQKEGL